MLQYLTPETLTFLATNPHAILQLPTNQTVTKINVAPSRRKANARNSGTQGSPLTWARLADISGENPDGARFGGSCRRTIDFD